MTTNAKKDHDVIPPEEITPQMMLEHFIVNFYEMFKGKNPQGHYTRLRNDAVESSWWRGFAKGKEEGYRNGYFAAKDEMRTADEKAEAATHQVIEVLCKTRLKPLE